LVLPAQDLDLKLEIFLLVLIGIKYCMETNTFPVLILGEQVTNDLAPINGILQKGEAEWRPKFLCLFGYEHFISDFGH
jgi:hypothetical protein